MDQAVAEIVKNAIDLLKIIIASGMTLFAGYLGYRYGIGHLKRQKKFELIEKQLKDFYSPLIGCIKRIKAKSELRFEISKASNPAWRKICEEHPKPFLDHEKYFEPFKKAIMYDNKEFREELRFIRLMRTLSYELQISLVLKTLYL